MSQNPFQPTAPTSPYYDKPEGGPKTKPTSVTVSAIICLILGLAGLGVVCMSAVGLGLMSFMADSFESLPTSAEFSEEQKEAAVAAMKIGQDNMGLQIVLIVLNLIVAFLLIVGAIGTMTGKSIGLFRIATLVAAGYVIFRFIVGTIFIQLPAMNKMNEIPGVAEQQVYPPILNVVIGGFVVLLMAGFYIWSHINSKSAAARTYFGS